MHHGPNCSGCPQCSTLARAILDNPINPVLIEAMGNPTLRTLAEGRLAQEEGSREEMSQAGFEDAHRTLRVLPPRTRVVDVPDAPNPYALRATASLHTLEPSDDPLYKPKGSAPDGYLLALAAKAIETNDVELVSQDLGTDYRPLGTPPDPYALALAAQKP